MSGRNTARHIDADPGWVTRRFRELQDDINALRAGKLSAVPGSTVTISQVLAYPGVKWHEWEWSDRLEVTTAGAQVFFLTHIPVAESLVLRWHPDGAGALTQVNERYTLAGQVVTIPDTAGDIQPGDLFSAQYEFDPNAVVPDEEPLLVVDSGTLYDDDPVVPIAASDASSGDYLIVLTQGENTFPDGGTISDGRLGLLVDYEMVFGQMSRAYGGTLSNLADVSIAGSDVEVTWAVLRAPLVTEVSAATNGPGAGPATLAQVDARHAVFLGFSYQNVVAAVLDTPTGYTNAISGGQTHYKQKISTWDDASAALSPATDISGSFDDYFGVILGVQNFELG